MTEFWIVHHDCQFHDHDCTVIGPFGDRDDARRFIKRHELETPRDGGYAFATVLPPDGAVDPAQMDGDLADALGEADS